MDLLDIPSDCGYTRLKLDASKPKLTAEERDALMFNIQLLRDAIVYFTATASARGVSGHTGGMRLGLALARWISTTQCIVRFAQVELTIPCRRSAFSSLLSRVTRTSTSTSYSMKLVSVEWELAASQVKLSRYPLGHRVATQYLLAALDGAIPAEHLLHYREANSKLPGHPELGLTPGVKFSSGRLGHTWCVEL